MARRRFDLSTELWRDRAACAGTPDAWWFTERGFRTYGVPICKRCPVFDQCEQYQLETRNSDGGWAGRWFNRNNEGGTA